MKYLALAATLLAGAAFLPGQAQAAGCLKGAMVGGAAGHFMGHHGWLGAGAGCLIGRHESNKHYREYNRDRSYNNYSNYR